MKIVLASVLLTVIFCSGASAKELVCSVTTTTSGATNFDKRIFSGRVDQGEQIFVNTNTFAARKLKASEITNPKDFDKYFVITPGLTDSLIFMAIGTWDASQVGKPSMMPDQLHIYGAKSEPGVSVMSESKRLAIQCIGR
jgi:hypothetical protein